MGNKSSQIAWHSQSAKEVLRSFGASLGGLSDDEVQERLKKHGENKLPRQKQKSALVIFFSQFGSPLITILVVAAFISILLQEWLDAAVICVAVFLNTILGFFEEYKADQSLRRLQRLLPEEVRVRRNGKAKIIQSFETVPGDILLLSTGDKITADGRIINSALLHVNEAALTGESASVEKSSEPVNFDAAVSDQTSMVFAGTTIVNGHAEVLVVQTGANTQIGQISKLVSEVKDEKTPLQQQLIKFSVWLSGLVLTLSVIVLVAGTIKGIDFLEMLKIAIAIAVSAIPEGLVVATTVILAIGMQRILKKQALVRRLVAAETLGSVSVICMDKTGTLTSGEMSVVEIRSGNGDELKPDDSNQIRTILGLTSSVVVDESSSERKFSGSPTEVAFAKDFWPHKNRLDIEKYVCLAELPFDPAFKFKAGIFKNNGNAFVFVVGAPDVLIKKSDYSDRERQKLEEVMQKMVNQGLRVILVGSKEIENRPSDLKPSDIIDIKVLGFIGLKDPLRSTASETIKDAQVAGLHPIMITGDHADTAAMIAKEVGLLDNGQIVNGSEIDEISDRELVDRISLITVFARVLPRHKLRIVRAWQERGASVAMVGDGVNDAPAMKAVDTGVAVGFGTEVAKETADMVLLDNNFSTIVDAIKEGRTIFDNIRKMIVYLLSDSFSEILLILGAIIAGIPLPILPAQILWINLITDGLPSAALTFEPAEKGIMREPPRSKQTPIMNLEMKILVFIIGILTDALLFGVYFYLLNLDLDLNHVRTFVFVALGLDSLLYVFAVRKFRTSIFKSHPFQNEWLIGAVIVGLLLLLAPLQIPALRDLFEFESLTVWEWGIIAGLGFIELLLIEIVKEIFNRKNGKLLSAT